MSFRYSARQFINKVFNAGTAQWQALLYSDRPYSYQEYKILMKAFIRRLIPKSSGRKDIYISHQKNFEIREQQR